MRTRANRKKSKEGFATFGMCFQNPKSKLSAHSKPVKMLHSVNQIIK